VKSDPVVQEQAVDSLELFDVIGDQRATEMQGVSGNQEVVARDSRALGGSSSIVSGKSSVRRCPRAK
jgi:hypothetical protein